MVVIRFIKSKDITEKVDGNFAGDALTDTDVATTFYGDITNIPESAAGTKYLAIAYVICDGETYWSDVVERTPEFNDLIKYE